MRCTRVMMSRIEWKKLVAEHIMKFDEEACFKAIKSSDKLRTFKSLKHIYGIEDFMKIPGYKKGKAICLALRSGTNSLRIDIGRRFNEAIGERICRCCNVETEDELHFTTRCACDELVKLTAAYKVLVIRILEKYKVKSFFDGMDDQMWCSLTLGDLSILPQIYHLGGERQGCAIEIYNLSLGHLEKLYSTRNAKLESIGLDERGIVCEEPQDTVSSTELRKRISEALSSIGPWSKWFGTKFDS